MGIRFSRLIKWSPYKEFFLLFSAADEAALGLILKVMGLVIRTTWPVPTLPLDSWGQVYKNTNTKEY